MALFKFAAVPFGNTTELYERIVACRPKSAIDLGTADQDVNRRARRGGDLTRSIHDGGVVAFRILTCPCRAHYSISLQISQAICEVV